MTSKGPQWERTFSKDLSSWFTHGKNDAVFWRTAGSGARATVRSKSGKSTENQCGDVTATDPIGLPLMKVTTIELKKGYKEWTLKELIDSGAEKPLLLQWFNKTNEQMTAAKVPCWWLVVRQPYKNVLIFFNDNFRMLAMKYGKIRLSNFTSYFTFKIRGKDTVHCVLWDEFKVRIPPELIIKISEKLKDEF